MLKQNKTILKIQTGVGEILSKIPISPNAYTIMSVFMALFAAVSISQGMLYLGVILFCISALFDAFDGAVARAKNQITNVGAFLDGVCDRIVEFFFLSAFFFYPLPTIYMSAQNWILFLVFFGTALPAYIRAYADHKEVISKEDANMMGGIFERGERVFLLAFSLIGGIFFGMEIFVYGLIISLILSVITCIQRINYVLLKAREGEGNIDEYQDPDQE